MSSQLGSGTVGGASVKSKSNEATAVSVIGARESTLSLASTATYSRQRPGVSVAVCRRVASPCSPVSNHSNIPRGFEEQIRYVIHPPTPVPLMFAKKVATYGLSTCKTTSKKDTPPTKRSSSTTSSRMKAAWASPMPANPSVWNTVSCMARALATTSSRESDVAQDARNSARGGFSAGIKHRSSEKDTKVAILRES